MLVGKKKFDEKFKHVLGIIEYSQDRLEGEKVSLELISNKEGDPLSCMTLLGHDYHQMASINLLVDKDIEKFRQNMYLSTKLCLLGTDTRGYLRGHVKDFFSALMSNNQDILEFFNFYKEIAKYQYLYTLENNLKIKLAFNESNFPHLLGLHKFKIVSKYRKQSDIIEAIKFLKISL